ncbi:uncharacterized protein LOC141594969 [Silene latifolia]|uniref:uncharacterized protein LOC141594969 n=1 Tax=Silene latifolia TaxID=37657 RepID=UPI003D77318B
MEGKLISYKNTMLAILLILVIVELMGEKAQGCSDDGQECGLFKRCCAGFFCNNREDILGGKCQKENSGCGEKNEACSKIAFQKCCGKLECSGTFSGTCKDRVEPSCFGLGKPCGPKQQILGRCCAGTICDNSNSDSIFGGVCVKGSSFTATVKKTPRIMK